jgi:hypothetical protein
MDVDVENVHLITFKLVLGALLLGGGGDDLQEE